MTASPRDHGLDDTAHFAALPASPLAAYALGMLHMLQRTHAAVDCAVSQREALRDGDAMARDVLAFLDDLTVPIGEKHALVATIERATCVADVRQVLHLHALVDAPAVPCPGTVVTSELSDTTTACGENQEETQRSSDAEPCVPIPEALGCSICCDELMLKPVSLVCGHSFCKRCVDMWLKSCSNCPTCRTPVGTTATAVNVALLEIMSAMFPDKLKQLEHRDELARLDGLRALIAQSIASGRSIRELLAQQEQLRDGEQPPTQADVSHLLESDPSLQQQVLAAEIRERLRKEKALREASRRRHLVAYCGALPAATRAHVTMIHSAATMSVAAPAPTPSVQSHRPVKKYVPPPPKKSPFFGNLLRRLHHDHSSSEHK